MPVNAVLQRMAYCNTGIGTGTGTIDVDPCTVLNDVASTVVGMTLTVDVDVSRKLATSGSIPVLAGTEVGVRAAITGTITSPSNPLVSLFFRPTE